MQLVIRDLSKTYPDGTQALEDVSLDVPQGMFGLLGPNGAGKSTLMRMIATLQEPDEGSIRFGDIDVLRQKDEVCQTLRRRRNLSRDVPLLDATDQAYIIYGKGAIAMYAMREQIGEEHVNAALRRYLEKHRNGGPPYPTSRDLYAELRAVTPDSLQYLRTDLFETVTLWDVKTERASAEPTGTDAYIVSIDVVAKNLRPTTSARRPRCRWMTLSISAPSRPAATRASASRYT
jgi:energy-coupling factor transporter ATP-binding protein EcfA2